jgi:hypothetical protein
MELGGELHKYTEILLAGNAVRFVNSSGEYIQINPSGEIEISSNGFG